MINSRVPYSASKFAIRGMMESLYVELRQNYPGNSLHLMLVSPFIVETGELVSPSNHHGWGWRPSCDCIIPHLNHSALMK